MNTEAENRHNSFNLASAYPSLVWQTMKYDYGIRTKTWKDAMITGMQWKGLPGLRAIGLGTNREAISGIKGGALYRAGTSVTKGIGSAIESAGSRLGFSGVEQYGKQFATQGVGNNIAGKFLGGVHTSAFKISGAGSARVTSALGTNWIRSLAGITSEKRASNILDITGKMSFTGSKVFKNKGINRAATKLASTSTAWKFALTQKIAPVGIVASNIAFAASILNPLARAAGGVVAGKFSQFENIMERFNTRQLDFGGTIHQSYMNGAGMTERQRALSELQRSRTNARSLISNEASLYHM